MRFLYHFHLPLVKYYFSKYLPPVWFIEVLLTSSRETLDIFITFLSPDLISGIPWPSLRDQCRLVPESLEVASAFYAYMTFNARAHVMFSNIAHETYNHRLCFVLYFWFYCCSRKSYVVLNSRVCAKVVVFFSKWIRR